MFVQRLKCPENQKPNDPNRSPFVLVEAMISHARGSMKYTRNATMMTVGSHVANRFALGRMARWMHGARQARRCGPPKSANGHGEVGGEQDDEPEKERDGGGIVEPLVGEGQVVRVQVRRPVGRDDGPCRRLEHLRLVEELEGADDREQQADAHGRHKQRQADAPGQTNLPCAVHGGRFVEVSGGLLGERNHSGGASVTGGSV